MTVSKVSADTVIDSIYKTHGYPVVYAQGSKWRLEDKSGIILESDDTLKIKNVNMD